MPASLASQANALRVITDKASPQALRRAGLVMNDAQGELLQRQIADAAATLDIIKNDKRVIDYIALALQAASQ